MLIPPPSVWSCYGKETTPENATIVHLSNGCGVGAIVIVRPTRVRVLFTAREERRAQAANMYALGVFFDTLGLLSTLDRDKKWDISEPAAFVGGSGFQIDGTDAGNVLMYIFGPHYRDSVIT